jgi:hypothetical protein
MDLFIIIQTLREEKKRIDRAITALEELASGKVGLVPPEEGDDSVATPPTEEAEAPAAKKRRGRPPKNPRPA